MTITRKTIMKHSLLLSPPSSSHRSPCRTPASRSGFPPWHIAAVNQQRRIFCRYDPTDFEASLLDKDIDALMRYRCGCIDQPGGRIDAICFDWSNESAMPRGARGARLQAGHPRGAGREVRLRRHPARFHAPHPASAAGAAMGVPRGADTVGTFNRDAASPALARELGGHVAFESRRSNCMGNEGGRNE